jgi:Mg2+-importing ATPase
LTIRQPTRWFSWLLGIAGLAAVVLVALHLSEERAFVALLEQARPAWLVWAVILQASTYVAQAEIWRIVVRRAGQQLSLSLACALSLEKLFVDQALPSMGVSGSALVAHALEQRGQPRAAVMAAVAVDAGSFYLAYLVNLAVALAILIATGHATPLILAGAALFFVFGSAVATGVLALTGRRPGTSGNRLLGIPGIGRAVGLLNDADPRVARDPRVLVRATVLHMLIAALDAATVWVLVRALGSLADPSAVFASFMLASLFRTFGFMPGGLGTFEAASVAALAGAGLAVPVALSATLLFRGLSFWLPMLPGLLLARRTSAPARGQPQWSGTIRYWSMAPRDVAEQLKSAATGLSSAEARERLGRFGPNDIGERDAVTRLGVLWNQFRSPLLLLLLFAAGASVVTGEWVDAVIVMSIVAASATIGYSREYRAQTAAADLRARVQVRASMLRDGRVVSVPTTEVVPGDIVLLSAGSIVPADGLLLEATDLFVNEAALTGESFPAQKATGAVSVDAPLARRTNCAYRGTNVRGGTARLLVVATGRATEFGKIAHRLALRPPETEFDRGIRHFGYLLTKAMMLMTVVVLAANLLLDRPLVETLLFSIALAVGLSPELLPAILSVNLARGARSMSDHGVLVRRLNAIENLGSMDVLCTDKTGTLTEGVVKMQGAWDCDGQPSTEVLELAAINAALQAGLVNPLDDAILTERRPSLDGLTKLAEIPYDFVRKRLSVVVNGVDGPRLITKGAVEHVVSACTTRAVGAALDEASRIALRNRAADWAREGTRVLAVATRRVPPRSTYSRDDERDLELAGFVTFFDRPKAGVSDAIAGLRQLGVDIKLITGDSGAVAAHVAAAVDLPGRRILTGAQLDELHDEALWHAAERTDLFVEVDPNQKERIILALKKTGHVVGFLGDGINDAPAMHAADTSLSVEGAVDVAREAADFVLLERDLDVIRRGIEEGRRTFANTLKYVLTTTSANLGNMLSMAVASLFLPFLPLLAGQVLLNNFLSDVPAIGLADDSVDPELVARPRRWDMRFLRRFMVEFGCLSSLFDFITFGLLLWVMSAGPELFRTGWFVESLLTELVIALVVRTRRPFWRSRPGDLLLWSSVAVMALTFLVPFLPRASMLGFTPLPAGVLLSLVTVAALYVGSTEILKVSFYRREDRAALLRPVR